MILLLCVTLITATMASSVATAQDLSENEEIVADAMTYLQHDYFQSLMLNYQYKMTYTENGKLTVESSGKVVYSQMRRECFSEANTRTRSIRPAGEPQAKPNENCLQKYNKGDTRIFNVRFYDEKPKPTVRLVSTQETASFTKSRQIILSNANLQGVDYCYPLGISYLDLVRTTPTRCAASDNIIKSEYDSIYGVFIIRVDAAQRTVLSIEDVQNRDSVLGIHDEKKGRKLSEVRSSSLKGSPKGINERLSRWDFEWTLASGKREI